MFLAVLLSKFRRLSTRSFVRRDSEAVIQKSELQKGMCLVSKLFHDSKPLYDFEDL